MNIVMNAEDSLDEKKGGNITITTEAGSKWGRLIVSDTGKGINKENLQKIFFPFFTTKKNTQRSGLGLSSMLRHRHPPSRVHTGGEQP